MDFSQLTSVVYITYTSLKMSIEYQGLHSVIDAGNFGPPHGDIFLHLSELQFKFYVPFLELLQYFLMVTRFLPAASDTTNTTLRSPWAATYEEQRMKSVGIVFKSI